MKNLNYWFFKLSIDFQGLGDIVHDVADEAKTVLLKGSMVFIDEGKYILYMCSVNVTTVSDLKIREKNFFFDSQIFFILNFEIQIFEAVFR